MITSNTTFFQKHHLFIILSLFLIIIEGIFVTLTYTQAKHKLHQQEYMLAQNYFAALDIAYEAQLAQNKSKLTANEIDTIFSSVFHAVTEKFDINAAILSFKNTISAHNDFIIKQSTNNQITSLTKITADYQHPNPNNTPTTVEIRSVNHRHYLYTTRPLSEDIATKQTGKTEVGQIVIWQDLSERYALLNNNLKTNITYAIAVFLLFELLFLLTFRQLSIRFKKIISQQTIELNCRNQVFQQLVEGKPLATILESLVLGIERTPTAEICSILLLDSEGKHLIHGAAPHLPEFYNEAVNGVEIGHNVGSCGTATFTRSRVIVEDIQSDPLWQNYKDLARRANLGACWSEPIIGSNDQLLGSFAIYHHQPTAPSEEALRLIKSVANLAAIIIQYSRTNEEYLLSSLVFNAAREGIMITDTHNKIISVNPMFCEITGYSRQEIIGKNPSILNSKKHSAHFYATMWQSIASEGHWQGEVWNRKQNGQIYLEQLTISALLNENGQAHHYVALFSDITHSKAQQESLELMAHYDVLTKLPNRALFADRFKQSIAHSKRNKALLAVCFLDLDDFKPINDNYGHDIGDQLLIEVAARLKLALREEDTVSRQGGDEFALLISNFESMEQCEVLLNRIHQSLAQPYLIQDETHHISASSGTTIYPLDDADIDTLLRHADQAMYQAKLAGKNNYRLFDIGDDQKIITQHTKLQEIKLALENKQFCLYYQPKVNMKTGKVFGVEALIRWRHPDKGLILPLSFLPVIDGTPLEIELGNWVINTALDQAVIWKKQGVELEISVNISSSHLQSSSFITQLNEALLHHSSIDPHLFQLEILESSALGDIETIKSILQTCRELLHVNIALDDFGTGYSSLTHLRILQANTIKIDQSFICNMLDNPNDYAIIEGIISLADSFNRNVIAEGVETSEHGITLLLMGCHKAQGYEISPPLPADEFPNWLKNYQANPEWISYNSLTLSPKDTRIKLMILATRHWYETFKYKQSLPPNSYQKWPLMNPKQCHHSAWLKRAHTEQLFDHDWLQKLEQEHDNMHKIATKIMFKHQNKDEPVTEEDLNQLDLAYQNMMFILKPAHNIE